MYTLKSLALLALIFSLSLAVFADTSNDAATHATDEVKPSEATDAIEPQQRGGCRYGCCGGWTFGRCNFCCRRPKAVGAVETEAVEVNDVEPQQRGRGRCRYVCCSSACTYCCPSPQAVEAVETEAVEANAVEPQQRGGGGGGGCRYGCCGSWRYGRCTYCCRSPQAEAEVVEPQQVRRCRYGCCGSYAYGQCSACCSKKMATGEKKKKEEAKP